MLSLCGSVRNPINSATSAEGANCHPAARFRRRLRPLQHAEALAASCRTATSLVAKTHKLTRAAVLCVNLQHNNRKRKELRSLTCYCLKTTRGKAASGFGFRERIGQANQEGNRHGHTSADPDHSTSGIAVTRNQATGRPQTENRGFWPSARG